MIITYNLADARRQPILLNPEGQQLFSLFESYIKQELPPFTNSKMNEMVNNMAAAGGELVPTIRKSVVDCLFGLEDSTIITDEQRGLTTTIVDKEAWPKEEKRIETALRLFPDILSEQLYGYYLIQWLAMQEVDGTYNLKNISLIPLVIKLGIESQQFADELRGGLLSLSPNGWIPLQRIICHFTKDSENNELRDDCFSVVRNWMSDNNCLLTEDIIAHNLCTGFFSVQRLRYLIHMNPVSLSLSCNPEKGNMLPIHLFSPDDIQVFRFQQACRIYGQEKVIYEVIKCIKEYSASTSTSAGTTTTNNTATSLLISAITDVSIHVDGVYILFRDNPQGALMRLQEAATAVVVVVREEKNTDTNFDININLNNKNLNTATATATASNNNNADASSSLSKTDTVVAASIIVVGSSTATNNNNNDGNHTDGDNGNVTQHPPSLSSSSSLKGKKRKHELV